MTETLIEETPMKTAVNVVWLKRDLRLSDHQPLVQAIKSGQTLLYYVFEPLLINDPHYDERHWRFVWQSIADINSQLAAFNSRVYLYFGDAIAGLVEINNVFKISGLFSHEEVGLLSTFERDKSVQQWCQGQGIVWSESQFGAVSRGKKNRIDWDKHWRQIMKAPLEEAKLSDDALASCTLIDKLFAASFPISWSITDDFMLKGGELWAQRTLQSFLKGRGKGYHFDISKPQASRKSCSRLSPYLAWGNISLREFYQTILITRSERGWKRPIDALASRLHWHCHFIQKFESEHQMQWRPVNKAYNDLMYPDIHCGLSVEERLDKWKTAQTGYPLVDACMRCLEQTGYINFRMRAMLVSFLCHHLLVDWRLGVSHLAQLFLDFEPGIHYPQFQMQSGVTGTNIIRVYNPVKQSLEKDSNGEFLRKWLPELAELPNEVIHTPWLLSPMEQQLYQCQLGDNYPSPMVDINETGKIARDLLWGFRQRFTTKKEGQRIVAKHVRGNKKISKAKKPQQLKIAESD
ncbi:cryptochrome/deoxyribodipyrimidine photo-lyase family protein [Colwellia hornerae]|nr:deoxyribodipyrimidine photo-lyase [Colwellia hornerae]